MFYRVIARALLCRTESLVWFALGLDRCTSSGNSAAAAFNAVLGNLLGVIVTPALLLLLVGKSLDMAPSLLATFQKLGIKVDVAVHAFIYIVS